MKEIETDVSRLRRRVFKEIAKLAYYSKNYYEIDELPEKILSGKEGSYRKDEEKEKAVLKNRLRLAMGLSIDRQEKEINCSNDIEKAISSEKYYELPLVNVITSACNKCPEKSFNVTNLCQGCLAKPCQEVCPKDAIKFSSERKSVIDQEKCIKCGRCASFCPYNAIVKIERPCAKACGVDAIKSDSKGFADIDYDKCVSCGACTVSCPFGAISDKSQIFQLIYAIKNGINVVAAVAPAFVGQFGDNVSYGKLKTALKMLGFCDVVEVAIGADLCSFGEAKEFVEKVPKKQPFMATSCCPAWSVMAKKNFKDIAQYISMELTPMAFTGRLIKSERKDVKVAFIGPCTAKKLEAFRRSVRSDIDFVLTFEEVLGMFDAKEIDFEKIEEEKDFCEASTDGRNFAVTNGVATAVCSCALEFGKKKEEILLDSAQGLKECKTMLLMAKAGKRQGYLLEGMACKGGCVGGPGTIKPAAKAAKSVNNFSDSSNIKHAFESKYVNKLESLIDEKK